MEIRVFDKWLNAKGQIDEINTLIWQPAYFTVGEFSMLVPFTANNNLLLEKGNIITKHEGEADFIDGSKKIWRRAAEITYKSISIDNKGQEQIEVKGYMLSRWLNKRCVYPQIDLCGTCQHIINNLIYANLGPGAEEKRRFNNLEFLGDEVFGGSSIQYTNEAFIQLGTEVKDIAQSGKLGYDLLVNEREKKLGFYLYKGKNLTDTNDEGNKPCVFSPEFDNINKQEMESSNENYKNYIYVSGKQSGNESTVPFVVVDKENKTGIELEEVYCDASDIERSYMDNAGEEIVIDLGKYKNQLISRGNTELASYEETLSFDSDINLSSTIIYKRDFNMGDRVTVKNNNWGIKINSRVTKVKETYSKGKKTINVTFGESAPTLIDKIRKVR